jgi:alkaline phosphatase
MKKLMILSLVLAMMVIPFSGYTGNDTPERPKYIFYFIGDGMGLAQASATEAYLSAIQGKIGFEKLALSTLPVQSFYTTFSESHFITCSSAGGTAISCGIKTSNGTICMDSAHMLSYTSIAEMARDRQMKVGIITSVSLDHATPACFYAHQFKRSSYYEISQELATSGFNFFGGGGFLKHEGYKEGDKNSLNLAHELGYKIVNSREDFTGLRRGDDKVIAISPVLQDGESLPYLIDGIKGGISLAEFTGKAIELLDNKNGFFLMVEGGKIDWACHGNDAATAIKEVIDFDESIKLALDFYNEHPDETLILVMADHETGGMSLGTDGMIPRKAYGLLSYQKCSQGVFSEKVAGYRENPATANLSFVAILDTVRFYFGLGNEDIPLNEADMDSLKKAYTISLGGSGSGEKVDLLYGSVEPLAIACTKILSEKAGIGWTTSNHTAIPVPLRALGVGQEQFTGYMDNTDISRKLIWMLGWD